MTQTYAFLIHIPFLIFGIAIVVCFIRLLHGPSLPDRVVALDLLANLFISATVLYSIINNNSVYIDVVIALALIIFLGTVAFAQLIEARKSSETM
jgi:multicomponent Na+:H+ antiporter subunit F